MIRGLLSGRVCGSQIYTRITRQNREALCYFYSRVRRIHIIRNSFRTQPGYVSFRQISESNRGISGRRLIQTCMMHGSRELPHGVKPVFLWKPEDKAIRPAADGWKITRRSFSDKGQSLDAIANEEPFRFRGRNSADGMVGRDRSVV